MAAILYLVHVIWHCASSPKLALLTGLILAVSPLEVAWPRYIFTETLAMSGSLFVFAELIKSLYESKLRVFPIGIFLVIATFIRLDGVLLLVPVAVAGFIIHRPADALRKGVVIAVILGLFWGGWLWRNLNVGLTNIYSPLTVELIDANKGFYSWGFTWSTSQYEKSSWEWPLVARRYDSIRVGEHAFIADSEKQKVRALLEELKQYTGKPFPKHIDDQFTDLAKKRIKAEPLAYYLLNPIKRIWELWSNIYDSSGWPIGLSGVLSNEDRTVIARGGLKSKLFLLKKYPLQTIGKVAVNGWKLLLYLLFLATVIMVYKGKEILLKNTMTLVLSFVLARCILTATFVLIEARYALMQMPVIEMMVVLVIGRAIFNRKKILQE